MSITIVSESTSTQLADLESVKRELSIASTDASDDKLISDLIDYASDYIRSYTDRDFHLKTITETRPSRGSNYMVLSYRPLRTLTWAQLDGTSVSSTTYEVDDAEAAIVWRERGWDHTVIFDNFITQRPTRFGRRDWSFRYQAGYILPGSTEGTRDLPKDIEKACIEIVKSWYLRQSQDPSVKREEVGEAMIEYFDGTYETAVPKSSLDLLGPYRTHDMGRF